MIDFNRISEDYVGFRKPFAAELFDRLRDRFGIGAAGQTVLDIGAGTGLCGLELQRRGCVVTFIDPSVELLRAAAANRRAVAAAEALPFTNDCFDVVTAAQCWHWLDRTRAPGEMRRVLRPGGYVAAVYQTYIPMPNSVAEATEELIIKYVPRWRHANSTGINGQVLRDMQSSGFVGIESFSFDIDISFTRESWQGFIRTTSPICPSMTMTSQRIEQFDAEHAKLLEPFKQPLQIPHRIFAAVARRV